jgi:hypothetical protein
MGHGAVPDDDALAEDDVYAEWHAGVLSADRPAERAMWSSGRGGREYRLWCVARKREERWFQRWGEYSDCLRVSIASI